MFKQVDIQGTATAFPYVVPKAVAIAQAAAAAAAAGSGGTSGTGGGGGSSGGTGGTGGTGTGSDSWVKLDLSKAVPDAISDVADGLDSILGGLNKLIAFITPVLNIIELFLSLFSSFTKAAVAIVDALEEIIAPIAADLGSAGVYMNILVPPALQSVGTANFNMSKLTAGGFNGFISRLTTSVNDPEDAQRPTFGPGGTVGGAVILVDGTSPDKIFTAMQNLAKMFDFMKLFGLQLSPPPPRNLRGYPSYILKDGKLSYCVKIKWDPPPSFAMKYLLSRSQVAGGMDADVSAYPTSIVGKDGWIAFMKSAMASGNFDAPTKTIKVYLDSLFNGGNPVVLGENLDRTGEYTDFDFAVAVDPATGKAVPDQNGKKTPKVVYYVVQSICAPFIDPASIFKVYNPAGIGPQSSVLKVPVRLCNSISQSATVIQHSDGFFEFLAPGFGGVGRWTSIQIGLTMPWLGELVGILTKFLAQIKGLGTDASDSFANFVNQIKAKITYFIGLIRTFARMITGIKSILSGLPSIAFLMVPPKTGGVAEFVNRVKTAKLPAGSPPFSGPDGISVGIVLMYGFDDASAEVQASSAAAQAVLKTKFAALDKAFKLLGTFFQ